MLASLNSVADQAAAIAQGTLSADVFDEKIPGSIGVAFRDMLDSLNLMGDQATAIANGSLDSEYLLETVPGEVGNSFSTMVTNLQSGDRELKEAARSLEIAEGEKRRLVSSLSNTADRLVDSSRELNNMSSTVSSDASSTLSNSERVAQAGQEVNDNVQSVSAAVEEMAASFHDIADLTAQGTQQAHQAVTKASDASNMIEKLRLSSREIETVLSVIDEIAAQTNLLALNAAIEAARAGDAGRGFAVVAGEVSDLASQTTASTFAITDMITKVQTQCDAAMVTVEDVAKMIDGLEDMSKGIAASVDEQLSIATDISNRVENAARGTDAISIAAEEVRSGAESTQSATGSARDATATLNGLADELTGLVTQLQ